MRFRFSFAAIRHCAAAVLLCIACGAAVAAELPDDVTFGVRVEQGDRTTVGEWLASGFDPNFECSYLGTGMMIAAWRGDIPMMELFLKHGADVNFENRFHEQALMLAVWKGQREAAGWLVLHGAKVTKPIAKGQLITTANTEVPANSKIAELRARQDRPVYGQ